MFNKKILWLVLIPIITTWCWVFTPSAHSKNASLRSRLLEFAGKSYAGTKDPAYQAYDQALREYMVNRIKKRFGISLDPKIYSGMDLLEIEALFKCKKPEEPYDMFLKMFPKYR